MKSNFPKVAERLSEKFGNHHFQVRFVYASRNGISARTKSIVDNVVYLDYNYLRYFANVVNSVKYSSRYELLEFLRVIPSDFGQTILATATAEGQSYNGSVLPEEQSHLPKGYKVVSFYVDAGALIARAYVLRRDGWRMGSAYQRLISKGKLEAIRSHLLGKNGTFLNNIIVTLPEGTKILNSNGNTVDPADIRKTAPALISLPDSFNSIGLIDGQHRVFSYYEGGDREAEIAVLRGQQNLLVTGIVFPQNSSQDDQLRFSAKLFLEINSNQSTARSDLKQEIGLILRPYSPESIAKRVINQINDGTGSLGDKFERYFFDKGKLKTTSVVSYGLRPLVRLTGSDTLFSTWTNDQKDDVLRNSSDSGLDEYVSFSVSAINQFVNAVSSNLTKKQWSTAKADGGLLNTTFVNGLISCLRHMVREHKLGDFDYYRDLTRDVSSFDFKSYKSSQYNKMGEELFNKFIKRST